MNSRFCVQGTTPAARPIAWPAAKPGRAFLFNKARPGSAAGRGVGRAQEIEKARAPARASPAVSICRRITTVSSGRSTTAASLLPAGMHFFNVTNCLTPFAILK